MEVTPQARDQPDQPDQPDQSDSPDQSDGPGGLVEPSALMLAQAAALMRDSPEPGWTAVRERLLTAVRGAARRSTPVRAHLPGPPGPDTLQVSDLVVVSLLRITLNEITGCVPSRIQLHLDEDRLARVEIALTAVYGADLPAVAEQARLVTAALLDDVLGSPVLPVGGVPIDVRVTDVVPGA